MEREKTMRSLVDMQRKVEEKQQRDRDRQLLRVRRKKQWSIVLGPCWSALLTFLLFLLLKVQERLSIVQNKKAEEDLLGLKQKEALEHLTHNLPQVTVYTLTHTQLNPPTLPGWIMRSTRDEKVALHVLAFPGRQDSAEDRRQSPAGTAEEREILCDAVQKRQVRNDFVQLWRCTMLWWWFDCDALPPPLFSILGTLLALKNSWVQWSTVQTQRTAQNNMYSTAFTQYQLTITPIVNCIHAMHSLLYVMG